MVDSGSGATPTGGTTAAVPAGELAVVGLITGGRPGTIVQEERGEREEGRRNSGSRDADGQRHLGRRQ